jgi:predicted CxxxxCH...CXXCH cytochrome family protein
VRDADPLVQSAPPFDLSGNTDLRAPGVGAHLVHLLPNAVHDGVACSECHVVPEATDDAGHADTELPAELVFGSVASALGRSPSYDAEQQRCSDTHCHLEEPPVWTPAAVAMPRCERCHSMPPPPPHPPSTECYRCHGDVVDMAGNIIDPSRHVDGNIDVIDRCDTCHGSGTLGAPPPDLSGSTDPTSVGVGAHQAHLAGGGATRPVECSACHVVPDSAGAEGHLDSTPGAELTFGGIALASGRMPAWVADTRSCAGSWCHGPTDASNTSPRWTEPGKLTCQGCHGLPPPAPHPQMTNCERCHGEVIDATQTIIAPMRHVDGVVDVDLPLACNACHGDATSAAPPSDLLGNLDTASPGVGAHRAHIEGSGIARKVACSECHRVPMSVLDLGHLDTFGPAELSFSGVAIAFGGSPVFDGVSCSDSYCHGDRFVFGHDSGGTATEPIWTLVDGSQKTCTSCHGLPPPPPHPPGPLFCSSCHTNFGTLLQVLEPDKHVNGMVDF